MDAIHILKLLRRYVWLLILVPLVSGVAAFFLTLNMERTYKSETTIATNFTTGEPVSFDASRSSYFETTISFVNAIETMSSPMVIDLVSFQLLLHDLQPNSTPFRTLDQWPVAEAENSKLIEVLGKKLDRFEYLNPLLPDEKQVLNLIKSLGYDSKSLSKNLSIQRVNNSDFIKVVFQAEDPVLAAYVVNSLTEQFIRFYNNMRENNSSESMTFFATLMKEKESIWKDRLDRLNNFKLENNVLDLTTESQSKIALITQYEQNKNAALEDLRNIQIELQYINAALGRGEVASQPVNNAETNRKIMDLKAELSKLNSQYIDGGSSDLQLKVKIDRLNNELALETAVLERTGTITRNETTDDLTTRKRELELKERMASERLTRVQNDIAEQRRSVSFTVGKDAELANLLTDVNVATQEHKMAQEKYNTAKNASLVTKSGLKQIVPGQPADEPESSKKLMLILLSVGASFALCLVYVFLTDFIDTKIKLPSRLEKYTNIKNVGMVNSLNADLPNLLQLLATKEKQERNVSEVNTFKQLLGKLRFETERSQGKVVLVTSAREKAGKSYLIVGLAHSLSMINKRVLIIDTNFKNNVLTRLLIRNRNGRLLKQHNLAEDETDPTRRTIISPTYHAKIDIIGNDGGNFSPLEIFKGGDFAKFLETVGMDYDYILLEGAALNSFSDSYELCQYVDKVLAVFSAESDVSEVDKDSLEVLMSLRSKLIGTVLNRVAISNLSA